MSTLSAVVPATNRPGTLAQCTAAIEAALDPPDEILIVEAPAGAGPAEARNAGARKARGDVLVFVDGDVVVHRDAFTRIRAAFDADPGLAAVFGSYDDDPSAPGIVSGFRNLLHHHVHQQSGGPGSLPSCTLPVRSGDHRSNDAGDDRRDSGGGTASYSL